MRDLISRQAAIEAVKHITSSMSVCINTDECHGMKRMQRQAVIELANLPSAQPEIIRCKDCKYRGGLSGCYCDIVEKMVGVDNFCSWAERRTDGV